MNADDKPPPEPATAFEVLRDEFDELHRDDPAAETGPIDTLDELYRRIHRLETPRAALCLSGGGIRSASFALGVIQGLAQRGLLQQFHYLSTVSGGGYIGAWLQAWRRHEQNDEAVFIKLNWRDGGPEAAELQQLRANSNFLTPKLGLLSADTWTAVILYLRNFLLNWFIFLPLFLSFLLIPHIAYCALIWFNNLAGPVNWSMLVVALALLTAGLAGSIAVRPLRDRDNPVGPPERPIALGTSATLAAICMPIYAGAGFLAIFAAWLPPNPQALRWGVMRGPGDFYSIGDAAGIGAAIYALAWLIGFAAGGGIGHSVGLARRGGRVPPAAELLAFAFSGAAAGAVIGLAIAVFQRLSGMAEAKDAPALLRFLFAGYDRVSMIVAVGVAGTMIAIFAADLLFTGLTSYHRHSDPDREWSARLAGYLGAAALGWLGFAAIVLYGPGAMIKLNDWALAATGGVSGLVTLLLGGSGKTAATVAKKAGERLSTATILDIATIVFIIVLAIVLSRLCHSGLDYAVAAFGVEANGLAKTAIAIAATLLLGGFSVLVSCWVNVNRFSLHAVYRNRLIRAFLGAARAGHRHPGRGSSNPDPFTGFDPADNLRLAELWTADGNDGRRRLFPVVNTALNVVASANLAWQERKAEPFAMTPLACGNPSVGYVPTRFYGDPAGGVSLGTAMAISGAAVSPNQGYHSSPIIGLLLMLFNVRLGWWLGNPRKGPQTYRRDGPRVSIGPIIAEFLSQTDDEGPYVYLSDGGHFENLGLYEMARRRCRFILISDAGSDPACTLEDLGNAVRKIWIDLGVTLQFERIDIAARAQPPADGVYCALGRIRYPEKDAPRGTLVYVKPGFHGTEPPDIRSYAALHATFPHESTGDQWFSESQMESYRGLGSHIIETMCGVAAQPGEDLSLEAFIGSVQRYLARTRPKPPGT
jgi:hypothetical protein